MLNDTKLRALKPRESVYRIADALGLAIRGAHDRGALVALPVSF